MSGKISDSVGSSILYGDRHSNKYTWPLISQTLADFEKECSRRAMEGNFDTVNVRFQNYDALWALAMALNVQ